MTDLGVRRISVRRARWERCSRPLACWFRNRWNWRTARRMRAEIRRWETLAVPLEEIEPHDDPDVQRMAEMVESLGHSGVLRYGYGMGEALLEAYRRDPERLRPLIDGACQFTLDQLRGDPEVLDVDFAVRARNDLLLAVREIVASNPKEPLFGD